LVYCASALSEGAVSSCAPLGAGVSAMGKAPEIEKRRGPGGA
jgi:hypothetical protein